MTELLSRLSDPLTLFGVTVALLIFCVAYFFYAPALRKIKEFVKLSDGVIEYEVFAKENSVLQKIYDEYKNDFIILNDKQRTKFHADTYFDTNNVIWGLGINPRKISSASGSLTGFGVLGTFLGLSLAVLFFKTETAQAMQNSISTLLGGMGTAFLTSIAGMLSSLIFIYYEKKRNNQLDQLLYKICNELNKKYYVSPEEITNVILIQHLSFLNNNNQKVSVASAMREIGYEMQTQTECLNTLVDDSDAGLTAQIGKMLAPKLESLAEKLDAIKSPTENLSQNISDEIKNALSSVMDGLGKNINDSAMDQINSLADRLSQASEVLTTLPTTMTTMMSDIQTSFGGMNATIEEMKGAMNSIIENSASSSEEILRKSQQENSLLVTNIQQSNKSTAEAAATFAAAIEKQEEITRTINTTMSQFQTIKEGLGTVVLQVKGVTENMTSTSAVLKNSQERYLTGMESLQAGNTRAIADIKSVLENTKDSITQYANQFETIKEGLTKIFQDINNGLVSYSTTVGTETQRVLTGYTDSVEKGIKGLQSAIGSLDAVASSLSDTVDEMSKRK